MKINVKLLSLFLLVTLCQCKSKKNTVAAAKLYKTVTILYSEEYCGGAAPSEELLSEMLKMKPLINSEVNVYKSNSTDLKPLLLKTNENGEVNIPIKLGNQVFISLYPPITDYKLGKYLHQCYKDFILAHLVMVDLSSEKNKFDINTRIECNPCVPPAP